LEEPKNPDTCNVFQLYKILGTPTETAELRKLYLAGNFGYGHAKTALYELLMEKFSEIRLSYNNYKTNIDELENKLEIGEKRAAQIANNVMNRVKKNMGT